MDNTRQQLILIVQQDPTLSTEEKAEILEKIADEQFYTKLIHGVTGATIGLVVGKFFKMSKPAQALLTIAGFGIGRYLLEETRKSDKFLQYNKELRTYEING